MQIGLGIGINRRGPSAFSPVSLFTSGSQGVWYDPSDLTTMFTDRAGTTPVTAPGQTVGLRLDKSKGLTLGPELVTNGDFSSATGWTLGAGWAISGGSLNGTLVSSQAVQFRSFAVGAVYRINLTVGAFSAGTLTINLGGDVSYTVSGTGEISTNFRVPSVSVNAIFITGTGFTGTIDNISVRELPGNHAVAPTDTARLIYGVEPKTGRRNALVWTEQFENAAWTKENITVTANTAIAPNGTTTATKLIETTATAEHKIFQLQTVLANTNYTITCYMKAGERTKAYIRDGWVTGFNVLFDLSNGTSISSSGGTASITSVGNGWYRCQFVMSTTATTLRSEFGPANAANSRNYTGDGTSGIYIWGAQVELGSTATAYQRVTTAYDVTEAGVPTCHYCQYDGSDDSMSTAAIDFTSTDKMSVFAGVRKLSDAAFNMIAELSVDVNTNTGSMFLGSGTLVGGGPSYIMFSRGNGVGGNALSPSSYAAPISNVLTGFGDISGDRATLRISGTQVAQGTSDQGTGNYGNYPLYIGRRGNATLPFSGKDYGIIVVGKTASAAEIASTEAYLAANTSGVTLP